MLPGGSCKHLDQSWQGWEQAGRRIRMKGLQLTSHQLAIPGGCPQAIRSYKSLKVWP